MSEPQTTDDRIDELESIIADQQETIDELQDRLPAESATDADAGSGGPITSRRRTLQALGVAGLLGVGATATASADPQGSVGTSADPLENLYTTEVTGANDELVFNAEVYSGGPRVPMMRLQADGQQDSLPNVIGGDSTNSASAEGSSIGASIGGGGQNHVLHGLGTIPGGFFAATRSFGQLAYATGGFPGGVGNAQMSIYVLQGETSEGTTSELVLGDPADGERIQLEPGRAMAVNGQVIQHSGDQDPVSGAFDGWVANDNNGFNDALNFFRPLSVGDLSITGSNGELTIEATQPSGETGTRRWVLALWAVEAFQTPPAPA